MRQHIIKIFSIAVILLVGGLIFSFKLNYNLKKDIAELTSNTKILEENFKALKSSYESLKKENQDFKNINKQLKEEKSNLSEEKILLSSAMKGKELEVQQTMEKLEDFERTVQKSIRWFRENSNIENLSYYDNFKQGLQKCTKLSAKCEIDLKCMYQVNKDNNIRYRYDEDTVGRPDFLKDLKLIHDQNGGDCEDFALLFMAEYNYLSDMCLKNNYTTDKIVAAAVDTSKDKTYRIDEPYMYVACGTFDPKKVIGNVEGHCLNVLTKEPIKSSKDIFIQIPKSVMVEPQLGEFYGYMNDTNLIKIFNDGEVPNTLYYIDFVISDDDLYIFNPYDEKIEWKGYKDFLETSEYIKGTMSK